MFDAALMKQAAEKVAIDSTLGSLLGAGIGAIAAPSGNRGTGAARGAVTGGGIGLGSRWGAGLGALGGGLTGAVGGGVLGHLSGQPYPGDMARLGALAGLLLGGVGGAGLGGYGGYRVAQKAMGPAPWNKPPEKPKKNPKKKEKAASVRLLELLGR